MKIQQKIVRGKHLFHIILSFFILIAIFASTAIASERNPSLYNVMDARERGTFNIGMALGGVFPKYDEEAGKEVLKFDYSASMGTYVGVWTKNYPSDIKAGVVDAVRISVKVPKAEQLNEVSVKLEIKGKKAVQTIPLGLETGWNSFREPIEWNTIGELKEVVFVVNAISRESVDGILYFDLDFYKLTGIEKNFIFVKIGLVFALGFIMALITGLVGLLFRRRREAERLEEKDAEPSVLSGLKRDFLYGIAAVMIAGSALYIYYLGTLRPLDAGFNLGFLLAGLMGAVTAGLLKVVITSKHLTPFETFRNIILTGLLAASSSRLGVFQAPSDWTHILMLSHVMATVVFLIYHISNWRSLASSGKHLGTIAGTLIVGTPYLFGWLMLVENVAILQKLINSISGNALAAWPKIVETIGRFIVVLGFNEAFANGISLVAKQRLLKGFKAHIFILFVSFAVVVSPLIADAGSTRRVGSLPAAAEILVGLLTTMFSFAGLWGEVYLITGIALDGGHRTAPSSESIYAHVKTGMRKGMAYSGILMAMLYALNSLLNAPASKIIMANLPIIVGILAGALVFPFFKTIVESFDGSQPFFQRTRYNYRDAILYLRGAVSGFGFAYAVTHGFIQKSMPDRILFGLIIGIFASCGMSILRDTAYTLRGRGHIQSWRLYFIDALLGAFIGSAAAFYLDSLQVPVIVEKFKLYTSAGFSVKEYITYPLVNKWGRIDLGTYTGGVKLIFTESLAGVINWAIAAWLFAINKVFMQAYFEKHTAPIKFFFSKAGFDQLIEHMIYVLRWGLWMSPIIFTFLRMMPNPTWYNQDGAIRTFFAIYHNATMSPEAFRTWSLNMFVYILAFDVFRVLIWMDHMGLRVATLVNLSFIGLDRLDERFARFIGPAAAQRYIPEAVKRFATWAPLLIPFYIPRGKEWDYVWNTSGAIQNARKPNLISILQSLTPAQWAVFIISVVIVCAAVSFGLRFLHCRSRRRRIKTHELSNIEYKVVLKENGDIHSEALQKGMDISRRSYDIIDPCGRTVFIVDESKPQGNKARYWPIIGNFPKENFQASHIRKADDTLKAVNSANGVRATINIGMPDRDTTAEIWEVVLENLTDERRRLKIVPYLEWVLMGGMHDRFHTQYGRLFTEMEYTSQANAILCLQRNTKTVGFLASDAAPEGVLFSRIDFIGRGRSIWKPRVLETLHFSDARDTAPYPTFDPLGSLIMDADLNPRSSKTIRLIIGCAKDKESALKLVKKHLKPEAAKTISLAREEKKRILIGHGEIPPGTPQPYCEFVDNGNKLVVRTPYTPRPYDHAMSNAVGHSIVVTNRGLHTSANVNSQQNRLTPDWPDTVAKEVPSEAIYLYDPDRNEWYCPTHHPVNDYSAKNESEFGVDGTAVFRMTSGDISTELTVFVPPDEPTGVYLLSIRNNGDYHRRMRVAPYFQMVLEFQPERTGELIVRHERMSNALFFENPRNMFHMGWVFASMSIPAECVETKRGRFFGTDHGVSHPFMVEKGRPDVAQFSDTRPVASFLGMIDIPAHGECAVAVILGEADSRRHGAQLVQKYKNIEAARKSLVDTRNWWLKLMETVAVKTNNPAFDQLQNWLKYQALVERVWARRGFYQTSGAFGYRDQLQDTVNLMWVDPSLARKQIVLHASQQFVEGDVFHWFFTRSDGRTAFSCRSHASDNPAWLAWAVVEYIKATGDYSVLDEKTSYVWSEFPFADLPKNKAGWGHLYQRSTREDTVYRHCLKSIDLLLERRMGKHGLPLIRTGDWNDGLDEIGSEGRGESVWLGFFLYYILKEGMVDIIEKKEGRRRKEHYIKRIRSLGSAIEKTWRTDRYLRAIHDDGTEIGVKDSGVWEIDALTVAWAVMSGINPERGLKMFDTALRILEKDNAILLGWPALREGTKPYLGRSSKYPEGVRENGMYCHGVQWLVKAARILAEQSEKEQNFAKANEYRQTAYRLWLKIAPISHVTPQEIEIYGGQPNKQAADILTCFDCGRMIWNGYTGAAGWMLRQAFEGVVGASLMTNELVLPPDLDKPRGELKINQVRRDIGKSPLKGLK